MSLQINCFCFHVIEEFNLNCKDRLIAEKLLAALGHAVTSRHAFRVLYIITRKEERKLAQWKMFYGFIIIIRSAHNT